MKNYRQVLLGVVLTILVLSRTGFTLPTFNEYLIDNNTHGTSSIFLCDIDGDGRKDLVASVIEENSMVWFRNEGGIPVQWTKHVIDPAFSAAWGVYAADIDGDGHMDVLGAAGYMGEDEVAWWRNSGADPITWEKHTIRADLPFAHEVYAIDFDSDGRMDVFAAASDCNSILWWHNNGGNPITWTEQTIDSTFAGAKSVRVGDIDGDSDNDVVGAALSNRQIAWWRNDGGSPIVWAKTVIAYLDRVWPLDAGDLDDDGDIDVFAASSHVGSNEVKWWENLLRGDTNDDQIINVSDVIHLINYLFKGGSAPDPLRDGDVNCDGEVYVSDVIYLINYLFKAGPKSCQ